MRTLFSVLLASAAVATVPTVAAAQTRKPAPKPVVRTAPKPAPKPAAKPAPAAATAPQATTPAPAPAPAARAAAAGANPFDVGTNVVNLGIGLGSRYGYGAGFFGGSSSVSPAISVSYERGIIPLGPGVLGVGVFAGYQGASYDFGGGDKWKFTDIVVTLRGAFHYPIAPVPQLDVYGGLGVGMRHAGVSYSGNSLYSYGANSASEATIGLFAGARYYFTPSIGAFAELGYDQTYLKAGLAVKF